MPVPPLNPVHIKSVSEKWVARANRRPERGGRAPGEKTVILGPLRCAHSVWRVAGRHGRVACATPEMIFQTRFESDSGKPQACPRCVAHASSVRVRASSRCPFHRLIQFTLRACLKNGWRGRLARPGRRTTTGYRERISVLSVADSRPRKTLTRFPCRVQMPASSIINQRQNHGRANPLTDQQTGRNFRRRHLP